MIRHADLVAFLALLALSPPLATGAAAQGYPVTDAGAVANFAEIVKTMRDTLQTLGDAAKPNSLLGTLKGTQDALGMPGATLAPLNLPRLDVTALAPSQDRWGGAAIDWSSPGAARDAVRKQLFLPVTVKAPGAIELQQLGARRARASRRAIEDATALALTARQKLTSDAAAVETLRTRADQPDLRRAVQANTDALLAVHDRVGDIALLLTALIELRATRAIEADRPAGQAATETGAP